MSDELFIIDENLLENEARDLAAKIITDDHPEHQFTETLTRTGSPHYCEMLASRAAALVALMTIREDTSPPIASLYGGRLGRFLHRARLERGLWQFHQDMGVQNTTNNTEEDADGR